MRQVVEHANTIDQLKFPWQLVYFVQTQVMKLNIGCLRALTPFLRYSQGPWTQVNRCNPGLGVEMA